MLEILSLAAIIHIAGGIITKRPDFSKNSASAWVRGQPSRTKPFCWQSSSNFDVANVRDSCKAKKCHVTAVSIGTLTQSFFQNGQGHRTWYKLSRVYVVLAAVKNAPLFRLALHLDRGKQVLLTHRDEDVRFSFLCSVCVFLSWYIQAGDVPLLS